MLTIAREPSSYIRPLLAVVNVFDLFHALVLLFLSFGSFRLFYPIVSFATSYHLPPIMTEVKANRDFQIFKMYVEEKVISGCQWELQKSPLGGMGVFATRAISSGDLLFAEPPLVIGPRSNAITTPVCVGCHRSLTIGFPCSKGCQLPVCGRKCEDSKFHVKECRLLRIKPSSASESESRSDTWSHTLLSVLTPIRCSLLVEKERQLLNLLEGHECAQHDRFLHIVGHKFQADQLQAVRRGCQVLDAVAFETLCSEDSSASLRGIYPVAAMMNHDCSPNTRHCFDQDNKIVVESSKNIAQGQEITTTYTCLTWGNQVRRHHLSQTKKFLCDCSRCRDPKEFESRLMALYCPKRTCLGVLLPQNTMSGKWKCQECGSWMSAAKITVIQSAVGNMVTSISATELRTRCMILRKLTVVPNCNQLAVELKLSFTNKCGPQKNSQINGKFRAGNRLSGLTTRAQTFEDSALRKTPG